MKSDKILRPHSGKSHLEYVDIIRGVGILLVVIGHHLQGYPRLTVWIYSFHMPLFFIISGWLRRHNPVKTDCKAYISKKAKSLLYPYTIFSVLIIVWKYLLLLVFDAVPEEDFKEIYIRSFSTYGYHALWFLPALFVCEVSVYYIESLKRSNRIKYIIYFVLAVIAFCISGLLKNMSTDMTVVFLLRYIGRVLLAIVFYRIGMILYSVFFQGRVRWVYIGLLLGASILLCRYNVLVKMSEASIGKPLLFMISALSGSLGVILLGQCIGSSKFLSFWGRNSLIVMLTHMDFSIEIAYMALARLGLSSIILDESILSIVAIIIELAIEAVVIIVINRYFKYLLTPIDIKQCKYH